MLRKIIFQRHPLKGTLFFENLLYENDYYFETSHDGDYLFEDPHEENYLFNNSCMGNTIFKIHLMWGKKFCGPPIRKILYFEDLLCVGLLL